MTSTLLICTKITFVDVNLAYISAHQVPSLEQGFCFSSLNQIKNITQWSFTSALTQWRWSLLLLLQWTRDLTQKYRLLYLTSMMMDTQMQGSWFLLASRSSFLLIQYHSPQPTDFLLFCSNIHYLPLSTPLKLKAAFTFVYLNQSQLSVVKEATRIKIWWYKWHINMVFWQ